MIYVPRTKETKMVVLVSLNILIDVSLKVLQRNVCVAIHRYVHVRLSVVNSRNMTQYYSWPTIVCYVCGVENPVCVLIQTDTCIMSAITTFIYHLSKCKHVPHKKTHHKSIAQSNLSYYYSLLCHCDDKPTSRERPP